MGLYLLMANTFTTQYSELISGSMDASRIELFLNGYPDSALEGKDVVFDATIGDFLFETRDSGQGKYSSLFMAVPTVSLFEDSADDLGVSIITATADDSDLDGFTSIQMIAGVPDWRSCTIDAEPDNILSEGKTSSIITLKVKDSGGLIVGEGGHDVTLYSDGGTISGLTDNLDGTYTAEFTAIIANEYTIGGTINGIEIDDDAGVDVNDSDDISGIDLLNPSDFNGMGSAIRGATKAEAKDFIRKGIRPLPVRQTPTPDEMRMKLRDPLNRSNQFFTNYAQKMGVLSPTWMIPMPTGLGELVGYFPNQKMGSEIYGGDQTEQPRPPSETISGATPRQEAVSTTEVIDTTPSEEA